MNGIYLNLLLKEISATLIGSHVEDIMRKERMVQVLFNKHSLYVSLFPTALGLFLAERVTTGYELSKIMSESVRSCRVKGISQHDLMPVLSIEMEKSFPRPQQVEIILSFYPEAPNFSLKTEYRQLNLFPRYVEKKPKTSIIHLSEDRLLHATGDGLVKEIEGIDKKLAHELNAENLQLIKSFLQDRPVHPRLVSCDPLHISLFAKDYVREFSSFNELFKSAIRDFEHSHLAQSAEQEKRMLIRKLKKRMAWLDKRLLKPGAIEHLRISGELILANIAKIKKGASSTMLFNPYTQSDVDIVLDPHLSPQDNAQGFFVKYKKEKRGQPKIKAQLVTLAKEIDALQTMTHEPTIRPRKVAVKPSDREPFHRFVLDTGSVILVGKNARSNDELTFKHARPSDYFFHTRGFEGAHVILRPSTPKGQHPSKDDVRVAASIAAHFSKARKQHNVLVSYTQRKFLKKAKKGKPGTVTLMREEVVFVDPGLPEQNKN
jgi:hypothetical protein